MQKKYFKQRLVNIEVFLNKREVFYIQRKNVLAILIILATFLIIAPVNANSINDTNNDVCDNLTINDTDINSSDNCFKNPEFRMNKSYTDKKSVKSVSKPSRGFYLPYQYFYIAEFSNHCPNCNRHNTLTYNPKGVYEGEWTCSRCDSDFDACLGEEKAYGSKKKITIIGDVEVWRKKDGVLTFLTSLSFSNARSGILKDKNFIKSILSKNNNLTTNTESTSKPVVKPIQPVKKPVKKVVKSKKVYKPVKKVVKSKKVYKPVKKVVKPKKVYKYSKKTYKSTKKVYKSTKTLKKSVKAKSKYVKKAKVKAKKINYKKSYKKYSKKKKTYTKYRRY